MLARALCYLSHLSKNVTHDICQRNVRQFSQTLDYYLESARFCWERPCLAWSGWVSCSLYGERCEPPPSPLSWVSVIVVPVGPAQVHPAPAACNTDSSQPELASLNTTESSEMPEKSNDQWLKVCWCDVECDVCEIRRGLAFHCLHWWTKWEVCMLCGTFPLLSLVSWRDKLNLMMFKYEIISSFASWNVS